MKITRTLEVTSPETFEADRPEFEARLRAFHELAQEQAGVALSFVMDAAPVFDAEDGFWSISATMEAV